MSQFVNLMNKTITLKQPGGDVELPVGGFVEIAYDKQDPVEINGMGVDVKKFNAITLPDPIADVSYIVSPHIAMMVGRADLLTPIFDADEKVVSFLAYTK